MPASAPSVSCGRGSVAGCRWQCHTPQRRYHRRALPPRELFGTEHDAGADSVLDEGVGTLLIDGIGGPVAGAVGRGDDGGCQCYQGIYHASNAIMEERRPQMKTTDH